MIETPKLKKNNKLFKILLTSSRIYKGGQNASQKPNG